MKQHAVNSINNSREDLLSDSGTLLPGYQFVKVKIRPWEKCDFPLLVELLGNPGMTEYLGGPESLEKIAERHERYCREIQDENTARLFAVIEEDSREGIGWVGY